MPIKVTCQCGKSFAAKDELAGKTVKCPSCQKPLKIPSASQPPAPKSAPAPKGAAPARPAAAPQPTSHHDDAFDDIGLQPQVAGTRPCPGCGSGLKEGAVVCLTCGYNMKLGRRMETVKTGGGGGDEGHGSISTGLLERAAQVIDDDKVEEQKKTNEGLPWWVWLIFLVVIVGFLGTMVILANREAEKPKEDKTQLSIPIPTLARSASEGNRLNVKEIL